MSNTCPARVNTWNKQPPNFRDYQNLSWTQTFVTVPPFPSSFRYLPLSPSSWLQTNPVNIFTARNSKIIDLWMQTQEHVDLLYWNLSPYWLRVFGAVIKPPMRRQHHPFHLEIYITGQDKEIEKNYFSVAAIRRSFVFTLNTQVHTYTQIDKSRCPAAFVFSIFRHRKLMFTAFFTILLVWKPKSKYSH